MTDGCSSQGDEHPRGEAAKKQPPKITPKRSLQPVPYINSLWAAARGPPAAARTKSTPSRADVT